MKRWGFMVTVLMLIQQVTCAQYTETIATSRPGASFTPFTTGAKIFQVQTGFVYDWYKDGDNYKSRGLGYSLLVRYGITENFEIRSSMALRNEKQEFLGLENTFGGLALWDVGFRFNILDGVETGTSLSLQSEFRINGVGPDEYATDQLSNRTIALFTTPIGDKLSFTTNLGVSWYDFVAEANGLYTLNLGFPYSDKLSGFVEMFGVFSDDGIETAFDTGVGYLVQDNLLIDLSFGTLDAFSHPFVDIGFSWRTSR